VLQCQLGAGTPHDNLSSNHIIVRIIWK